MADERTLRAYEAHAARYLAASSPRPAPDVLAWIDRFCSALPSGPTVLELGSGPGTDAVHLEARGVRVLRSDAARAFAERLRAQGHDVLHIDVRTDPLPQGLDGVFANAVLLHLRRDELAAALIRIHSALRPGGVLAFSVKEGVGEEWSVAKLGAPRFFTYWREGPIVAALAAAGFEYIRVEHVAGTTAAWLQVIATTPQP